MRQCNSCDYYDPKGRLCRRMPPALGGHVGSPWQGNDAVWPFVDPKKDWCGEYRQQGDEETE